MLNRVSMLIVAGLVAGLAGGCGPTQASVEQAIKEGIKAELKVDVKKFDLKKQESGGYTGSATTEGGDIYDITTQPITGNKVEWKAVPGQAMVEHIVRDGIEKQMATMVTKLQLTKESPGTYSGSAEISSGRTVAVKTRLDGSQLVWEAK